MRKFNGGRPYHGSSAVEECGLRGATGDTDYFYFFCPKCEGNNVMRVLEYGVHAQEPVNPYNELFKSTALYGFTLVFKLHCEGCGHSDFVKISNTGLQKGPATIASGKAVEGADETLLEHVDLDSRPEERPV